MENGQAVTVQIDGVTVGTAVVNNNTWSLTGVDLSAYADGASYTVTADVSDAAGNPAVQASRDIDTVDTTAPTIANNQQLQYDENRVAGDVIGTVSASDSNPVVAFRFAATGTNLSADGYFQIAANGVISITAAGVASGVNDFETSPNLHTYALQAQDQAGNWSTVTDVRLIEQNLNDNVPTTTPVTLAAITEDSGMRLITQAELLANASDIDGQTLTANSLTIASGKGDLIDNGNGTWTYTPAGNDDTNVTFSYTVTDGSSLVAGSATLDITPVNDAPSISASSAWVSEEGLVGGRADSAGTSDITNSTTFSGQMSVQDVDSSSLTVTLNAPTNTVTSGGQSISWSGAGTGLLIGYVGSASAGNEAIRVSIDNSGNYTVTLSKPLDHGTTSVEDTLPLNIGVTVSDGSRSSTNTLSVVVEDDMPSGAVIRTLEVPVDTVIVKNLQGGFENGIFVGGTSTVSYINNDSDNKNDTVTWGTPSTTGGSKSGYSLVDNSILATSSGQIVSAGNLFKLADFSHINMPINSNSSTLDQITLSMQMQVSINGTTVTVPFTVLLDHTETPNDGSDPRDIITLPTQDVIVDINGQTYTFRLEGFQDNNGTIVNTIYTDENATNVFGIYGSLNTTLPMPSVSGSIIGTAGADGFDSVTWGNLTNAYGTLTTSADGSYRFVLNEKGYALVQAGTAVPAPTFSYTVRDKDGDTFSSTLTINLQADKDSTPVANDNFAQAVLTQRTTDTTNISGFSVTDARTGNGSATEQTSSSVTVSGGTGTITFNASLSGGIGTDYYRYALETQTGSGWSTGTFSDLQSGTNTISNLAAGTYRVRIYVLDRSPNFSSAVATLTNIALITTLVPPVTEAAAAAGNVLTDTNNHVGSTNAWGAVDSLGQEGAVVSAVNGTNVAGNGTTNIAGLYGNLSIAADGSYTYTPYSNYSNVGKSETFTYTLNQPDGDSDTANLIINIGNTAYTAPTPISGSGTLNGTSGDDVILGSSGIDTLTGNGGNDHLEGKAGNDTLYGGAGKDILIGGESDDILFGGAEGDTFAWHAGHIGNDTIKDFTLSGTDRDTIDLRDLLQGENDANIGDYLRVITTSNATTLEISTHGEFSHGAAADVSIKLESGGSKVDLSSLGSTSSEIINSLVAQDIVKIDHS